ncbi:response regulator [Catellatospora citrea]|uniref:DNA-binding response regulator n=1 Tax=Catellatospora citrea TaxID=53366 RepID=A0A8J3KBH8_9ACTN|nr:response regulator transcription factor [Catellatospora citrea]RKE11449.1 LuxR family two component transcriptional regulator [Catellatospora citrea]GIF99947.1 DNA-binding response regulator [Catellatospora citrea]
MTIRVVVADDQPAVRSGIVLILGTHPDIEVVGEAPDGARAVELCRRERPDVALLDVRMPVLDGIAATREIVAQRLAQVLILTTFDLDEYVFGGLRAGAAGFLLKDIEAGALADAVRTVARGDAIIAPAATRRLLDRFLAAPGWTDPAAAPDLDTLTGREQEVLGCLGAGMSNGEVALALAMAEATVKTHVSRILAKLGLRSRVQAAILAREHGLRPPG